MRRLLAPVATALLALIANAGGGFDSSPAEASHDDVIVYVYHPTASDPGYLRCGWHSNCDGNYPDTDPRGLDWTPCSGCEQTTWVRMHAFGGGASQTKVAEAQSYDSTWGTCPFAIYTDVKRIHDSALYGRVINLHSDAAGSPYFNMYSRQAGWQNSGVIGSFVNEANDPCSSYNHTMQWYESGTADISWSKNTSPSIPTEAQCRGPGSCNMPFNVWSVHEYVFTFEASLDTLPTTGQMWPGTQGDRLISMDGRFTAIMQTDGNFVVYRIQPWTVLWASSWCGLTSFTNSHAVMQGTDGNFVVYPDAGGPAVWATSFAQTEPGCSSNQQVVFGAGIYMVMQNDGNRVMYKPGYGSVWNSNGY